MNGPAGGRDVRILEAEQPIASSPEAPSFARAASRAVRRPAREPPSFFAPSSPCERTQAARIARLDIVHLDDDRMRSVTARDPKPPTGSLAKRLRRTCRSPRFSQGTYTALLARRAHRSQADRACADTVSSKAIFSSSSVKRCVDEAPVGAAALHVNSCVSMNVNVRPCGSTLREKRDRGYRLRLPLVPVAVRAGAPPLFTSRTSHVGFANRIVPHPNQSAARYVWYAMSASTTTVKAPTNASERKPSRHEPRVPPSGAVFPEAERT